MRFSCDESSWTLDQLHPAEWHFICELPEVAAGRGLERSAESRLLPDPIQPDSYEEREKEAEFLSDWEEFVKPDLELTFQTSRAKVEEDLKNAEITEGPQFQLPEDATEEQKAWVEQLDALTWRKVEIGRENADDWYSTLNQARILLHEAHDLAGDDSRHLNSPTLQETEPISEERGMLLTQYEFYSVIQSILIDQVMEG